MPALDHDTTDGYSALVGLVYIFNLIVGTGALTMPAAFKDAGWLLSLIVIVILAFMSYLTTTFTIEALAAANALVRWKALKHYKKVVNQEDEDETQLSCTRKEHIVHEDTDVSHFPVHQNELLTDDIISRSIDEDERLPLLLNNAVESVNESSTMDYFAISERFEMGKMASLFFNKVGVNLFYVCIIVYLYGDLAIYAAAVSKSVRNITCVNNMTSNATDICWPSVSVSMTDAYRVFLTAFLCCLGPFTFFNVQKTKYLQILTTLMRWIAFSSMIILCAIALAQGKGQGHPVPARFAGVPNLFGVCIYSFMCHHSLPSLVTPIQNKSRLFHLVGGDYLLILFFYSLLSFTGIFTFNTLDDMYTLNFQPNMGSRGESNIIPHVTFLQYFLSLFPVFTLSTNFPIIAITLRNNLKTLFLRESKQYSFCLEHILFPFVAVIPPVAIAFATESVEFLVGITGSYAGAVIQYVVPVTLVYYARKNVLKALGLGVHNQHASPFRHGAWLIFVLGWAATCIIFVTVNHIITRS